MAKRKESPLPKLPELPNPLEVIERFNSAVDEFQRFVDTIDRRIHSIDNLTSEVDEKIGIPPPTRPEIRKPKPHKHLSYEGQTELDYCLECAVKHSQTAKILAREALQRARAGSPSDIGVLEKVRGVVEELVGLEDDTDTVKNDKVATLNSLSRTLRKFIYTKRAEIGGASLKDLEEIKSMTDKLVDAVYTVRTSEECIGCDIIELCRGNLECIEFIEKAARTVKSQEEFKKIIREAREKYKRG